jgi:hypothetical protein
MVRSVPLEAGVVGVLMAILFAMVHLPMMQVAPKYSMTHSGIFLGVFLAGAIGHLLLEAAGLNKRFCDHAYKDVYRDAYRDA